jgi:hypothetical protein
VLVVAAGQKRKKPPTEEAIDHFEKLLKAPCSDHRYPVRHVYTYCRLLRKFLGGGAPPEGGAEPRQGQGGEREKGRVAFLGEVGCLLIYGGPDYYALRRHQKPEQHYLGRRTWP